MPRPSGLTPDTHAEVVNGLRLGMKRHEAAAVVGISERCLYQWIARGRAAHEAEERLAEEHPEIDLGEMEDPEFVFREFYLAVMQADAGYKRSLVAVITRSAVGAPAQFDEQGNMLREEVAADPKMALAMLERRDPREWGRTHRVPTQREYDEDRGRDGTDPADDDTDALRAMAFELLERVEERRHQRESAGMDPAG